MNPASVERGRKERLLQMIDVAQAYRGCSKAELASYLDRDPAKIAPDSGNPKLDLLFNLADVIDWPIGDLAEMLWGRHRSRVDGREDRPRPDGTFKELDLRAREAHRRGDYAEMRWLGQHMLDMATTPIERACALTRLGGAFHDEGRYGRALEHFQAAILEQDLPLAICQMLRANLATVHLALWNLTEAEAIGRIVLMDSGTASETERKVRVTRAHARYLIGSALLRGIQRAPGAVESPQAAEASVQLQAAHDDYARLAAEFDDPTYRGVANTCKGGLLELAVVRTKLAPHEAMSQLLAGLGRVVDPNLERGDMLESWGWWCVSGLGIALRHLQGDARERSAAIFSNKLFELAEATGNWALRERAFSLSFVAGYNLRTDTDGAGPTPPLLDKDDLRVLVGTMGRFPFFRPVGWRILNSILAGNQ